METLLRDLPRLLVYLGDILITGSTLAEHLANLEGVLKRLSKTGLHLNKEKFACFLEQIVTRLMLTVCTQLEKRVNPLKMQLSLRMSQSCANFWASSIIIAVSCPPYQPKWHPYTVHCERRPGGLEVVNSRRHSL